MSIKIGKFLLKITLVGTLLTIIPVLRVKAQDKISIDWNELNKGSGPVVFLVNGNGGCAPCIARDLHTRLKENNITVYDLDWNDIYRRNQNSSSLNDAEFLQQMDSVIKAIPNSRPIVLIGHSFGGDSVLKVAQRTSKKISLLGVLDAVEAGGFRTGRSVNENVTNFYNRWTTNSSILPIPFNLKTNGAVSCHASVQPCSQEEQSYAYEADGSPIRDKCGSLEFTCPGYEYKPKFLGGSNGSHHRELTHGGENAIYRDKLIQEQLFQKILEVKNAYVTPDYFAALAVSNETGSVGYSWGSKTQQAAEVNAKLACKSKDCQVRRSVINQFMAVVYDENYKMFLAENPVSTSASEKALSFCRQLSKNPNSCTLTRVIDSKEGITVDNPLPKFRPGSLYAKGSLHPEWPYTTFTYQSTRPNKEGKETVELLVDSSGKTIARQTTADRQVFDYQLYKAEKDYIIMANEISKDNIYYIKINIDGSSQWTAGEDMDKNGWLPWADKGTWSGTRVSDNSQKVRTVSLHPEWPYTTFTYQSKRTNREGKETVELLVNSNGKTIARQTTADRQVFDYQLYKAEKDYIIMANEVSKDNIYYIKINIDGSSQWTAGEDMNKNGWLPWADKGTWSGTRVSDNSKP